jgi:thiosulfate/3-mercaptopyruvate sulfurtransferase
MKWPGGPTVSTEWLAANLDAAGVRVVDIRGTVLPPGNTPRYRSKREDYEGGHIPGAAFLDWTRDIVDLADPVPGQIAPPDVFAAKMRELGIGDDTLVVVYDDYKHIFAGRFAWALRYYGHDDVRVLDGGWSRWLAEGRVVSSSGGAPPPPVSSSGGAPAKPVSSSGEAPPAQVSRLQPPAAQATVFTPRPRARLRRTADEVAASLDRADVLLIDARPPEQYEGAASAATRAGHIPGARNVPYARLIDAATQTFLPREQLARAFSDAGIDVARLPREVVVYCNGGVSCTVPLQALEMLGRDDVAVYDGSWNEWGNDASRPIRSGPKP